MGVEGRDDDDKAREKAAFLTGRNGEMVKFNCIIKHTNWEVQFVTL